MIKNIVDKIWKFVQGPPLFVRNISVNGSETWGEVKRTYFPPDQNGFIFHTAYDIVWEDGSVEKNVPTRSFQWDGLSMVRRSP